MNFKTLLICLFRNHWVTMTLNELNESGLETPRIQYDEKKVEETLKGDTLLCLHCGNTNSSDVRAELMFGGRGVKVFRRSLCFTCARINTNEIRFRDGYAMVKRNDEWMAVIYMGPEFFHWLFNGFKLKYKQ